MVSFIRNAVFVGIALLGGLSCTRPVEADFGSQEETLGEDQLMWVIRIPRVPEAVVGKKQPTHQDSLRLATFNEPLFAEGIPKILQGLVDGKLHAYEDYAYTESETPIQDLQARLKTLNASLLDYTPFTQICEVVCFVESSNGVYQSRPIYVRLFWRDPEGVQADRSFASIRFTDLTSNYTLKVKETNYLLSDYFGREFYRGYPVFVRSNDNEYSLKSQEEAEFVMRRVKEGSWKQIPWVDNTVNLSGKRVVGIPSKKLIEFEGPWQFEGTQIGGDTLSREEVFISPASDYLLADWSHRFRAEKIFPFDSTAFFSPSGDLYFFEKDSSERFRLLFVSHGDSVWSLPPEINAP